MKTLPDNMTTLPKNPEPLYSCKHCREECSHPAADMAWSDAQDAWICRDCWDSEIDGDFALIPMPDVAAALVYITKMHAASCLAARENWQKVERLTSALQSIANMPEYDQDDARRLRYKAQCALLGDQNPAAI